MRDVSEIKPILLQIVERLSDVQVNQEVFAALIQTDATRDAKLALRQAAGAATKKDLAALRKQIESL